MPEAYIRQLFREPFPGVSLGEFEMCRTDSLARVSGVHPPEGLDDRVPSRLHRGQREPCTVSARPEHEPAARPFASPHLLPSTPHAENPSPSPSGRPKSTVS